jgi:N-acetyl-gamma-glutamyl-phosphate reductase
MEVLVFGASGYSGQELVRILARHPNARIAAATSDREAGRPIDVAPELGLSHVRHDDASAMASRDHVAFLATPAETSAELAPRLLDRGARVVDLSGAFRLSDPAAYREWYGFVHPKPELLAEAHYGIPELFAMPPTTRLVANPGCYATASILAVAPLLDLTEGPVIIDGKSGTTGAGKKAEEAMLFAEVAENLRAYRVGKHQHTPEIEEALSIRAGREVKVSFTAHLVPMRRGILVTAYLRAKPNVATRDALGALERAYAGTMVRVVDRPPETQRVLNTNGTEVGAHLDARTSTLIAFGAIDNLVRGAAGQAVQNMNAMIGLPIETGLR